MGRAVVVVKFIGGSVMSFRGISACCLVVLGWILWAPASAHHGTSVNYDSEATTTIKGTVTQFVWRNPHSALILEVTTDTGEVITHAIELPSPASMAQSDRGWNRRTFKTGDVVEIVVHPSRTGAPVSQVASCDLGGCNPIINGKRFEQAEEAQAKE